MLRQALILTADREYAMEFRQYLERSLTPVPRVDIETDPLRVMQLSPQNYDLIILDALILNIDGLQLLLLLHNQAPQSRFCMMADEASEIFRYQALQNGASLYLQKPRELDDWHEIVSSIQSLFGELPDAAATSARLNPNATSAAELIQTECLSGGSCVLEITSDIAGQRGQIFIFRGELFHGQCPGKSGEDAVREMLGWPGCRAVHQSHQLLHAPPHTVETPWQELLQGAEDVSPAPEQQMAAPLGVLLPDDSERSTSGLRPEVGIVGESYSETIQPVVGESPTLPGFLSHWKINFTGELLETDGTDPDPQLTFSIFQKLAEVAVELEQDYSPRITFLGNWVQQELISGHSGIRHALFSTAETTEEIRDSYLVWCYERDV